MCLVATPGNMAKFALNQNLPGECAKWDTCVHRPKLHASIGTQACSSLLCMVATGRFQKVRRLMSWHCLTPSCTTLRHAEYNPTPHGGPGGRPLSGPSPPLLLLSSPFPHCSVHPHLHPSVTPAHPAHSTPGPLHQLFSFRVLPPADSSSSFRAQLISPLGRR